MNVLFSASEILDLIQRMKNHHSLAGGAVVKVTARELQRLIHLAEKASNLSCTCGIGE